MPGVTRLGDSTSSHGCPPGGSCGIAPPTISGSASGNVFVNGLGAVRYGDVIVPHSCLMCANNCTTPCPPHSGSYIGSHDVYVNSRMIQTQGDPISCTCTAVGCSPNVIVN